MTNPNNPEQLKYYGEAFLLTKADKQEMADICNNSSDWATIIGSITLLQKKRLQDEGKKILDDLEQTKKSERELKAYIKKLETEKEVEAQSLKQLKKSNEEQFKKLKREKDELETNLKKEKVEKESLMAKLEELKENLKNVKSESKQHLQEKLEIFEAHETFNLTVARLKNAHNLGDSPRKPIRKRKPPFLDDSGCFISDETSRSDNILGLQKRVNSALPPLSHIGPANVNPTANNNKNGRRNAGLNGHNQMTGGPTNT